MHLANLTVHEDAIDKEDALLSVWTNTVDGYDGVSLSLISRDTAYVTIPKAQVRNLIDALLTYLVESDITTLEDINDCE